MPRGHPDGPALDVLSDLLTCGRRARLWSALVEHGRIATWVDAAQDGARRAGQLVLQVEAAPDIPPARIEETITAILDQLADAGPTPAELARSRNRLEAAWRWEQEDLAGLAAGLGQAAPWGDWRAWQAEHRAALAVEADDIRRVVSTYLTDANLTVGWSLPRPNRGGDGPAAGRGGPPSAASRGAAGRRADDRAGGAGGRLEAGRLSPPSRRPGQRTASGLGATHRHRHRGAGAVRRCRRAPRGEAGSRPPDRPDARRRDPDPPGRCRWPRRSRTSAARSTSAATGASLRVRAEDLPLALEILADVVRRPAFPAEALPWARRRIAAELQGDRDDPAFRADLLFRHLVYGDHPYARDPRGSVRDLNRLTLDDVQAHHARHFAPDNALLVAVGDFDTRRLQSLVKAHFRTWEPSGLAAAPLPRPVRLARPRVRRMAHPGEQVHIVLGHLGIVRNHPDFAALAVLDHIFGSGPGFNDRLSRIVRDEMGLAYSVGGGITDSADLVPGLFRVYVGTMPDETDRVVAAIVEQVRAMHAGAFSDDEVERARRYVAGSWVFEFQTVEQRAERLLELRALRPGTGRAAHLARSGRGDHPPPGPPRRPGPPRPRRSGTGRVRPDPPPRREPPGGVRVAKTPRSRSNLSQNRRPIRQIKPEKRSY